MKNIVSIAPAGLLACIVLITLMTHVLSAGAGESGRPNYEEMRRYVISKLSDEQIRQMHKDSIAEFEEFKSK